MRAELQEAGHELQLHKCLGWIPALDAADDEQLPADAAELFSVVPRTRGGMKVLGAQAAGEVEAVLGGVSNEDAPAAKRASKAELLVDRLREFALEPIGGPVLQTAWTILSKVVARLLDYDARLTPSAELAGVLGRVDHAVEEAVRFIAGTAPTPAQLRQLRLPGPLGGMGLRKAGMHPAAAFWASFRSTEGAVASVLAAMGYRSAEVHGRAAADAAAQALRRAGCAIGLDGRPAFASEADEQEVANAPWHTSAPFPAAAGGARAKSRHLSDALRIIEAVEAARAWASSAEPDRIRWAACGGEGTGKLWSAVPDSREVTLPDPHFRVAFRMRLGMHVVTAQARCQIKRSDESRCLAVLDDGALHPLLCKAGGARLRPHRAVARCLGRVLGRAGAATDFERGMPHLEVPEREQGQEPTLDVVATWPTLLEQFVVDVTIRCPAAARYADAAKVGGGTAAKAEEEKAERYGCQVLPLAFESWGRLGAASVQTLQVLAAAARTAAPDPRDLRNLVARWRLELEAALAFATTDIILLAAGSQAHVVRDGALAARAAAAEMRRARPE